METDRISILERKVESLEDTVRTLITELLADYALKDETARRILEAKKP